MKLVHGNLPHRKNMNRPEHSWSLFDPKPIVVYLPRHDEYIVYWNGVVMTHAQALCLAMEISSGVYCTPQMKICLQQTFEKLYYCGAFNTRSWDDYNLNPFDRQKSKLSLHIKNLVKDMESKEVLSWFDFKNARIAKDELNV